MHLDNITHTDAMVDGPRISYVNIYVFNYVSSIHHVHVSKLSIGQDGWRVMSSHLVISALVTLLPVYILVHMVLAQPGEAAYFYIWG